MTRGMRKFNNFIIKTKLLEIPLSNGKFTWSREGGANSRSLLDRLLISSKWDDIFANSRVSRLVRILFDHFPILLEADLFEWGPPPFRFCNSWIEIKDCCRIIENTLESENQQGWVGFVLSAKLRKVKDLLKVWNMNFERAKKKIRRGTVKGN